MYTPHWLENIWKHCTTTNTGHAMQYQREPEGVRSMLPLQFANMVTLEVKDGTDQKLPNWKGSKADPLGSSMAVLGLGFLPVHLHFLWWHSFQTQKTIKSQFLLWLTQCLMFPLCWWANERVLSILTIMWEFYPFWPFWVNRSVVIFQGPVCFFEIALLVSGLCVW